ncbi:MAG TPA: FIST N-terminal domain-containing protein [Kofleriaceae bacterium]|nr:FIST N-terminal domain-containing protein [Kofleriaceae bacterium]
MIATRATVQGWDAARVAGELGERLRGERQRLVLAFADWRLEPATFARELQRACSAPVVGCSTLGVVGDPLHGDHPAATALALHGDAVRVGIGLAAELPASALGRSRDAVYEAAGRLGRTAETLDSSRHVALTLCDGRCRAEGAFCIGSAAAAPQIRFVGGFGSTDRQAQRHTYVFASGEALAEAGVVVMLECELPFEVVTSMHLAPTEVKTVVTATSERVIDELDGRPAGERLRELVGKLGAQFDPSRPWEYSFARFVDGVPYVRTMTELEGTRIHVASDVEPGHVLRLMRSGDLIARTREDLAAAAERVGGQIAALIACSCVVRHWDAAALGLEAELAAAYAQYPTTGFQSFGEQSGMLLVNHTLTGLAIGDRG